MTRIREADPALTDPEQFGEVFDRYFAEIHGYAARRVGRDAAADIAAEVFLTAFRLRHRFDPSRGTVRAWLYGITTNHLSVHHRREQRAYRAMARVGVPERQEGRCRLNPAALKKLILAVRLPWETPSQYLLDGGDGGLLAILEMPITPAVRAALYEMLAAEPGIMSLGEATDPAGQQGEAVSYTASYQECGPVTTRTADGQPMSGALFPSCTTQEILIINPATGLPMAEELRYASLPAGRPWKAPDELFSYEIFGQPHWTNARPPVPAR